jgi:hypothetical protein
MYLVGSHPSLIHTAWKVTLANESLDIEILEELRPCMPSWMSAEGSFDLISIGSNKDQQRNHVHDVSLVFTPWTTSDDTNMTVKLFIKECLWVVKHTFQLFKNTDSIPMAKCDNLFVQSLYSGNFVFVTKGSRLVTVTNTLFFALFFSSLV